jgi:hypothetical protein
MGEKRGGFLGVCAGVCERAWGGGFSGGFGGRFLEIGGGGVPLLAVRFAQSPGAHGSGSFLSRAAARAGFARWEAAGAARPACGGAGVFSREPQTLAGVPRIPPDFPNILRINAAVRGAETEQSDSGPLGWGKQGVPRSVWGMGGVVRVLFWCRLVLLGRDRHGGRRAVPRIPRMGSDAGCGNRRAGRSGRPGEAVACRRDCRRRCCWACRCRSRRGQREVAA